MNKQLLALHALCMQIQDQPHKQRLLTVSEYFLGFKYGAWANGSSIETLDDFNYDLDTLDCVLYPEVVLALLKTKPDPDYTQFVSNFEHNLRNIHYANGTPNFLASNHFFCIDWIKNNNAIVNDITHSISATAKIAATIIDKLTWFKQHQINHGATPNFSEYALKQLTPQLSRVPYIESTEILSNYQHYVQKFPEYAMVVIVRPNWDIRDRIGTHLNISHLGFAIKDSQQNDLHFLHATSEKQLVVRETLGSYLQRQLSIPTIRGIEILAMNLDFA